MATFHSGKTATATINGTEPAVTGWSINPTAQIAEFKNSKTGSFTKRESTFKDLSFSIDIDFDFDQNPWASPLSLTPGNEVTNVKLFLLTTAGAFHSIPNAIITGTPQSVTVEGKPVTRVNLVTDGTYSLYGNITP